MEKREVKPDLVVFATGYRQEWGWLGEEYPCGPGDERVDVREVCGRGDLSVGWVGFVRPGVGVFCSVALSSLSASPFSLPRLDDYEARRADLTSLPSPPSQSNRRDPSDRRAASYALGFTRHQADPDPYDGAFLPFARERGSEDSVRVSSLGGFSSSATG